MSVPVVHVTHIRLDDRDASLNQPARQQERLAERVAAVAIAEPRILTIEVEGLLDAAGGQHRERLVLDVPEAPGGAQSIDRGGLTVDLREQRPAPANLIGGQ